MKQRYEAHVKECLFSESDYVWYYVPRRKQGRNHKWTRLCDIFRVDRRFNDVLYQIQFSLRAKSILAHVDKLRKCDAKLPKRRKDKIDASSCITSSEYRRGIISIASPTTDPTMGPTTSPKSDRRARPEADPVMSQLKSPNRAGTTNMSLRSQAQRKREAAAEVEPASVRRPVCVRHPPARLRTACGWPTEHQSNCHKSANFHGVNTVRSGDLKSN
jgi:hypothetical protein